MKPFQFYAATNGNTASARPHPAGQSAAPRVASGVIRSADMLALVIFGARARTVTSFAGAYDAGLVAAIQNLPATVGSEGATTNLAAGIRLANGLLANAPQGLLRRAWVLSDGVDTDETEKLFDEVARSRALRINVNTIGFGDPSEFNESRLRDVAKGTHNGRYIPVATAKGLGAAFLSKDRGPAKPAAHRGEATVFVIDTSGSMASAMEGSTKIAIVRDTLAQLIRYKQRMWS